MAEELHIASVLVQCQPSRIDAVAATIGGEIGVEIPVVDPAGKLIVMIESPRQGAIADLAHRFSALQGVLSCNLVFHGVAEGTEAPVESQRPKGQAVEGQANDRA